MTSANFKSKKDRFQLLMEQIALPEELFEKNVQEGYIDRLQLFKAENKWIFHFVFPNLLAVNTARFLFSRLPQTFAHIAHVELRITFEQTVDENALFTQYWPVFLEEHHTQLNGLHKRLQEHTPLWNNNRLCFTVVNEVERDLCRKKVEPILCAFYQTFIDEWKPKFVYDIQDYGHAHDQFVESIGKEDEELAKKALLEMASSKKERTNGTGQKTQTSGQLIGKRIMEEPTAITDIHEEERRICVQGYVFDVQVRKLKSGRHLLMLEVTDYTDSLSIKMFSKDDDHARLFDHIYKGMWLKVRGGVQFDTYQRELVMMAQDMNEIKVEEREDTSEEKRVELHLHTNMSTMDGLTPISAYVEQAAKWGHPAMAVTDHGVAQSFPEAYSAGKKHGVKILYGTEAYLIDDGVPIAYEPQKRKLEEETYVVFDVETTGLSAVYNKIIELAAVKIHKGEEIDRFERFVNPHESISEIITKLTGITDDMVKDAPEIDPVLEDFYAFIGDHTLVAHNASFDMGFLHVNYRKIGRQIPNPVIDTLELGRFLFPEMKSHRLNVLCKKLNISLDNHHRAVYDAEATAQMLWKMLQEVMTKGIDFQDQLNDRKGTGQINHGRPTHCILLAKDQDGLKNLYKLISYSLTQYFHRVPRIPRSVLTHYRHGLLVGSACDQGEVFQGMMQKSPEEVEEIASFYDYLEIQPVENYEHLLEREMVRNRKHIQEILENIVQLAEKLNKPAVATGNVHYLKAEDHVHRKILITTLGGASPLKPHLLPHVHFRTTDEMLELFQFLGEERARDVVITAPNVIQNQIEDIMPVPEELFTPKIEGADEDIRQMCADKAKSIYGDPLPELANERLEKELNSIISNGFSVIYLISQKLVKKSLEDGYLVGSRGSVGSSFVATMTGITEVNPLPPHYVCLSCHYIKFYDDGSVGSGFDLPDENCPECGQDLLKDGHDIPFETFLGFKGDKVPDIDLNFSGEYQPIAHKYTQELFGKDNVYRAGTIGTVADKTAYGFVKKYEEEQGAVYRQAEIKRLAQGCTGVKRTTGQHPGGIIVIPDDKDIYDFTPVQFPADDQQSEWRTTHFDFHSIHDNLLKLDILGHDDPTMIRMLQDLSGVNPDDIPTDDPEVMKLFNGTDVLGVTEKQIMSKTGTLGIPEFGTRFVRQMLEDTRPTTFAELVRISGLSHGTDVWLNNAQELIHQKKAVLAEVISTRDDIMVYLIHKGLEPSRAFQIMEKVRKGKGLTDEETEYMRKFDVPDWYIWSCLQIKYMFPKAHAVAYVLMAVRIAYFKVHYPIFFYASYFTVRADDFDVDLAVRGSNTIRKRIEDINQKGNMALPKEKSLLTILELCLEMVERGFRFHTVDLYRSDATQFKVDGEALLPPFNAIPGVGTNAAINIVHAREQGEFLSKEDVRTRSKVTKTVIEYLDQQGCLTDLPETNQLSLF